jgi:hypothetical protein
MRKSVSKGKNMFCHLASQKPSHSVCNKRIFWKERVQECSRPALYCLAYVRLHSYCFLFMGVSGSAEQQQQQGHDHNAVYCGSP